MIRFLIFLISFSAFASLNEVDKQFLAAKNLLRNPGFENGKAGTSSTGGSYTLITSDILNNGINGKVTASWDPSAADQYLNFGTITYYRWSPPAAKNGIAFCSFRSGYSDYTLQVYDGTNVIAEQVLSTGGNSSLTKKEYINFAFPTTTTDGAMTITVRLKSTADAVAVLVDDCFLGLADEVNLSAVQPRDVFSAKVSNADAVSDENTDWINGDCTNATAGHATCTFVSGIFTQAPTCTCTPINNASSSQTCFLKQAATSTEVILITNSAGSNTNLPFHLQCQKASTDSPQTAYRPDAIAFNWSGFHSNDCSFTRSSSSYGQLTGDSSCTFTEQTNSNMGTVSSTFNGGVSLSPGISFQTTKATTYHVCANANYDADGNNVNWQMIEKTSGVTIVSGVYQQLTSGQFVNMQMCGNLDVDSVQTTSIEIQCKAASGACALTPNGTSGDKTVQWSIFGISQQLPAPLLVNSVTSNSSGVEGIHRAFITNTGTPTISSGDQSGDWIDSITDGAAGVVKVNFKAGVFSRKPTCTAMCVHNGTNCTVFAYNNTVEPSTTAIELVSRNSAGTGVDEDIMLICMGPR